MSSSPLPPGNPVAAAIRDLFAGPAPVARGDRVLVAFSGGPDSTALLAGLEPTAAELGLTVEAAHLDHGGDDGSRHRAWQAADLADALGVPLHCERLELAAERRTGESREEAARRIRYAFLERMRLAIGARWILTAHHRDDQMETVLLRILQGSGWQGLGGIAAVRGRVARPLLGLPRTLLAELVRARGLEAVSDPTNADLTLLRNAVRHRLVPRLTRRDPNLAALLASVAMATSGARDTIDRRLAVTLDLRDEGAGASLASGVFESLPGVLRSAALALLHRRCGLTYPPSAAARRELDRCLAGWAAACDAGGGWRWLRCQGRLHLERPGNKPASFAYTLRVPGEVQVPEVGAVLSLRRGEPSGAASAAVMHRERIILPADPEVMLVRNRRPGDRIRPIGRQNRKRLKEVLIDQRIPRHQRDALPLLVLGGDVVWVPGVAVADGLQVGSRTAVWTAELSSIVEVDPS